MQVAVGAAGCHGYRLVALPETVGLQGFYAGGVRVLLRVVQLLGGRGGAELGLGGGVLRLLLLPDVGRDRGEVSWAAAPQGTDVCETATLPTTSSSMSVKPHSSERTRGNPAIPPYTSLAPMPSSTFAPPW